MKYILVREKSKNVLKTNLGTFYTNTKGCIICDNNIKHFLDKKDNNYIETESGKFVCLVN